jgi:hypothetical protein
MPDLWVPGSAEPSLDDLVARIHRQIELYTQGHSAEQSVVEVELSGGERVVLHSLSAEPGYGFVTMNVHADGGERAEVLIVPVGSIRRIALGPAEADRSRFGFALPDDGSVKGKGAEPAA